MSFNFNISSINKPKIDYTQIFDFVSIGGGPASYNASLYAKRKGLNVLIIAKKPGGQLLNTSSVDNYLGFKELSGEALYEEFHDHVKTLDVLEINDRMVDKIEKKENLFYLTLDDGNQVISKTILVATGSNPRKLGIKGEIEFSNAGVAYCAICDAPLFKGKDVIIAGGGNSAVEAAIDVAKIARHVTLVHRSQLRADQILIDKMNEQANIEVYLESQILEIEGDTKMRSIRVLDKASNTEFRLEADGIFIEIGNIPNSELVKDLVQLNNQNEIIVNRKQETSLEGCYSAGDVTDTPYKQIIIATAEGAKAALAANEYINTH
jgi:alkyl hydroperoxide reductase subunit F